jgi:hypothetical protein
MNKKLDDNSLDLVFVLILILSIVFLPMIFLIKTEDTSHIEFRID